MCTHSSRGIDEIEIENLREKAGVNAEKCSQNKQSPDTSSCSIVLQDGGSMPFSKISKGKKTAGLVMACTGSS